MPFYRVLVHGSGELANGIKGFYATRWAFARSETMAASKVIRTLEKDWSSGEYRKMCAGRIPAMEAEEIERIGFHQIGAAPNRGYIFYSEEEK